MRRPAMMGAALALGAMAMFGGGMPAIEPRRIEIKNAPTMPRDKRKRLDRALSGGHRSRGPFAPLPFILHAGRPDDGLTPLCWLSRDHLPLFGAKPKRGDELHPHRIAVGRDPTCNNCQRALWAAEQKRRLG